MHNWSKMIALQFEKRHTIHCQAIIIFALFGMLVMAEHTFIGWHRMSDMDV